MIRKERAMEKATPLRPLLDVRRLPMREFALVNQRRCSA